MKHRLYSWKFKFPHAMIPRPHFLLFCSKMYSFSNLSPVLQSQSPHMHFGFAWKVLFLLSLPKNYFPFFKAKITCFQSLSNPSWPFIPAHRYALKGLAMCGSSWLVDNIQIAKAWVGSTSNLCDRQLVQMHGSTLLTSGLWDILRV